MNSTKTCTKCGISKPLDEFYNDKTKKDGKRPSCKKCTSKQQRNYNKEHKKEKVEVNKIYYQENKEKINKSSRKYAQEHEDEIRKRYGHLSMYENKLCASYLGVVIAECLIRHLFENVKVMPYGFPDYDFICNKGKLIDVKSGCICLDHDKYPFWKFYINRNTVADYFICVAFDNKTNINLLHIWIIPGKEINHKRTISIRPPTIHKWSQWKRDTEGAQICCTELKKEK